ncbi:MAG TPA: hypothetical protein VFM75_07225 [Modicisalibacter sp.]|nr:hypothetical protein [Modicisalibacter sp.]
MSEELKINFEFACRDDCLDRMVPSDLRRIVSERDQLRAELSALKDGQGEEVEIVAHICLGAFSDDELGEIDIDLVMPNAERLQHQLVTGDDLTLSLMTVAQHQRIVAAITSPPSAPGTVQVPIDPLLRALSGHSNCENIDDAMDELRAILAQHEGVKP